MKQWRERRGREFWQESDHFGDHNYDGVIDNLLISRLHVVKPSVALLGVTINNGELRSVLVTVNTGWYPEGSVWVQEWFDSSAAPFLHVSRKDRPRAAAVDFSASLPDTERERACGFNTRCLALPRGCTSAEAILPYVWQLDSKRTFGTD